MKINSNIVTVVVAMLALALILPTACAKKPAEFEVSSLVLTPSLVLPGQEAIVEADITNVGEVEGTHTAILTVNGVETDTRVVA